MKNLIAIVALVFAISCTKSQTREEFIVLGTNATYPPYEMVDDKGEVVGFDIDVAKAIAFKLGKKLEIQNMQFDALILALKQQKFDMIMAGLSITPSRQKEIAMLPYQGEPIKSLSLLFWEKTPLGVRDVSALSGQTVAVQSGTQMENYLGTIKGVDAKALEGTIEVVMDVKHGKSAAALLEPHIANEVVKKHPQLKRVDFALSQDAWVLGNGIGLKKENAKLISEIQSALEHLKKEGVIASLEAKWFHQKAL